jgi:arsenate reductase
MGEGLVNHFLGDRWEAVSAGTAPTGYVHPMAVQALGELGIDISAQCSKSVDEFRDTDVDVVITVCGGAAEDCPVWLGNGRKKHIGFPDPAAVTGSEEEQLHMFLQVRDGLCERVFGYLEQVESEERR